MTELSTIHAWPALSRPVLIVAMEGWIDAGLGGSQAMSTLLHSMPNQLMATFDADALIDHRARRPILRVVNGVDTELRWPEIELRVATAANGRSLLLLSGPEPDMHWHGFITEIIALSTRLGVDLMVGLGAFPAPVPHTRSVRLASTATNAELAARVGLLPATIDVPAGAQAALEFSFGQAGIGAVGLWARVPHYASAIPYPAASAALLDQLAQLIEIEIDTKALHAAAVNTTGQIEQLIAGSDDHAAMVRQLEAQHDSELGLSATDFGALPSGDEIAAELERFLRRED